MKGLMYFLSIILLVSCSSKESAKDAQFYAGVAQSVITPDSATFMNEPRGSLSTGTHDDLFVKAIALGDGKKIFVIACFDLIGFDESLIKSIRRASFDSTGIEAEQLMLSCSHTHNSPITRNGMFPDPYEMNGKTARDVTWEKWMVGIAAGTVKSAVNNLNKVTISQGKAPVQIGFNRRLNNSVIASMAPNPNGPALKETDVLFIRDDRSEIAVLFSYAAHPVSVHASSTEFTADYPGYAARYIQQKYSRSIAIFLQGCAGNVNSTLRGGYEAAESDGNKLGEAVIKSAESSKTINPSPILYGQRNFYLPFIDIDTETAELVIKRIGESLETMKEKNPDFRPTMSQIDMINWAQRVKYVAEHKDTNPGLPIHVQALTLGRSLAVIALPGDVFVDYALYIKEHSPFEQTIVLGYANGNESYLPSAEAFYLGGYETTGAQVSKGQPYLTPACDKIVKTESMELLNELWEKYSDL
jgi:neutral ceramidase